MVAHDGHSLAPHDHIAMDDGRPKPCSGRWWCAGCREWESGPRCVLPGAPALPADWLA
jgi:hypothetical protein